jgi:hypothetical protein
LIAKKLHNGSFSKKLEVGWHEYLGVGFLFRTTRTGTIVDPRTASPIAKMPRLGDSVATWREWVFAGLSYEPLLGVHGIDILQHLTRLEETIEARISVSSREEGTDFRVALSSEVSSQLASTVRFLKCMTIESNAEPQESWRVRGFLPGNEHLATRCGFRDRVLESLQTLDRASGAQISRALIHTGLAESLRALNAGSSRIC